MNDCRGRYRKPNGGLSLQLVLSPRGDYATKSPPTTIALLVAVGFFFDPFSRSGCTQERPALQQLSAHHGH
jgi:hypothetical protein